MENRCLIGGLTPQLANNQQVAFIFAYYGNHNDIVLTQNVPEPKSGSESDRFT